MPLENPTATLQEGNESLFDAISHGIDNEGALPPADDNQDDSADDTNDPSQDEGDQPTDGGGEDTGDATPDDDATDEEAAEAGYARDPATGKFVKKPETDGTNTTATGTNTTAAAQPRVKDPINDPIPQGLKRETQERIQSLIGMAKQATEREQTLRREYDTIVQGVMSTGATPEQYGEVLQFLGLVNSQDPAKQRAALEQIENLADSFATLLGVERRSADPLAAHQDLQAALKAGQISKEFAMETARLRNRQSMTGNINQQQQQQIQQRQQFEQVQAQARQGLDQLWEQLKNQPGAAAKRAALVPILQPIFKTLHPSQWVNAFHQAWQNHRVEAPAPAAAAPRVPKNQPMRAGKGTMGGGSTVRQTGSALDAVNAALGELGV